MIQFIKETIEGGAFELVIDKNTFSKDEILKAAYNLLDKGYFLFYTDENGDSLVQCTPKSSSKHTAQEILLEFSDELLSVHLRYELEKENKAIRETIIWVALTSSLDPKNFIQWDQNANPQVDFDRDIHDILKEIENDPDLKINNEEIEEILKEIEQENNTWINDKKIAINLEWLEQAKSNINKKS